MLFKEFRSPRAYGSYDQFRNGKMLRSRHFSKQGKQLSQSFLLSKEGFLSCGREFVLVPSQALQQTIPNKAPNALIQRRPLQTYLLCQFF